MAYWPSGKWPSFVLYVCVLLNRFCMPPNRILSIRPVTKAVGAAYYVATNNEGQVRVHALLSSALADFSGAFRLLLRYCPLPTRMYRTGKSNHLIIIKGRDFQIYRKSFREPNYVWCYKCKLYLCNFCQWNCVETVHCTSGRVDIEKAIQTSSHLCRTSGS